MSQVKKSSTGWEIICYHGYEGDADHSSADFHLNYDSVMVQIKSGNGKGKLKLDLKDREYLIFGIRYRGLSLKLNE